MEYTVDLFLGSLLILSGFVSSVLSLRRIIKTNKISNFAIFLSENLLLTCIGITFITRSLYKLNPIHTKMDNIEERSRIIMKTEEIDCDFKTIMMSYGPFTVSLVNSFLNMIISNYMYYSQISNVNKENDYEVRELNDNFTEGNRRIKDLYLFIKKHFALFSIILQWILPVSIALPMYLINMNEVTIMDGQRGYADSCMALIDAQKDNCSQLYNETNQLRAPQNYLETYEFDSNNMTQKKHIKNVVDNVYNILANLQNNTYHSDVNVSTKLFFKKPKDYVEQKCMKICYLDNKNLLLYMFGVFVISYFVPITISTILITKIHILKVKNQSVKPYVSRELLYNILFWTPVIFDTFLSITVCSYAMNGMRTSIFNVIANVYQVVKNFMNQKYLKDNTVVPV